MAHAASKHGAPVHVNVSNLEPVGWDDRLAAAFAALGEADLFAGRVFSERRGVLAVFDGEREVSANIAGRLRHRAASAADLPTVGDFVAVKPPAGKRGDLATVQAVLPRRSKISRKAAGQREDEQMLAANVDTVVVLSGLDGDFNVRRLERYMATARAGGADVLVLLTKADLVADIDKASSAAVDVYLREVEHVAPGVPVEPVRLLDGPIPQSLVDALRPGRTCVLLGSSGVGKSTLINRLVDNSAQATAPVRASDSRGRHTTTHREMFVLPSGALIIDTPGLRELQLLAGTTDLDSAFPDVVALSAECRFRDCRHDAEPGCAVLAAQSDGRLPPARYNSYRALRAEIEARAARRSRRR